jgi:UDPglucose 6-dehydrogenase
VQDLAAAAYVGLVTIKSTVTPGTTARLASIHEGLRLAFCPEFLRERAAVVDFSENHDVCVIGTNTATDYSLLVQAHGSLPRCFRLVTPTEAELCKYFSNVFNALRVTFANEFYEVCRAVGANYDAIKDAMIRRDNITDAYLSCNANTRGFGGVCLPKDTAAFAAFTRSLGLDLRLFDVIIEENAKFKMTVPAGMRST